MANSEEWISAADALALFGRRSFEMRETICRRAHVGLVRARAERIVAPEGSFDNEDVPPGFWWAEGKAALDQDWEVGDFSTHINDKRFAIFGVKFRRADIEKLKPAPAIANSENTNLPITGSRVFIGHGRSALWLELHNFLRDKLRLEVDEFNRIPVAGIATVDRLKAMLENAKFAFVVMTGEDETPEGKLNARLNVIHELGLFQGRLGFTKAIVLLEDGCEKFSNIEGLSDIRFPKGKIDAKFQEIREVLQRERVL